MSSNQAGVPGVPGRSKPAKGAACQKPTAAPEGSWATDMWPSPGTSIGGKSTVPPAAVIASAVAAASSVAR